MNYRFSLNDNLHANLISSIQEKANGGSINAAMKLYVIERFALQTDRSLTCTRQKTVSGASNEGEVVNSDEISLDGLDSIIESL